jgi:hypothetical protein
VTRIVIHVGSHKTGTTYLQQGFVALREPLRAAGIDYPAEWQDHLHGHHSLVRMLASGDAATPARLAALADQAGREGRGILFSSENFEDLDDASVARLASALQGHAVEIVFFARRWAGLLPSAWQEQVKQGGSETYPQFLLTHLAQPSDSRLLNPMRVLGRYADAFGRNAIRLVAYDRVIDGGEDLLAFFLQTLLGVPIVPPTRGKRVNGALPAVDIEIIRLLNAMARRWQGSVPGGVWPMKLFYELGGQGLPAIAVLRTALRPFVTRCGVPDDLAALREIELQTIDRFGIALPTNGSMAARAPGPTAAGEHVAGEYWMDPLVPPAFAELRDAMRRRHAEIALAA